MKNNPLKEDLDHILKWTLDSWEEVRGQRIFLTGGTGFFGCWFLESFLWVNEVCDLRAGITVLTRHSDSFVKKAPHLALHSNVVLWEGDVRSFEYPQGEFAYMIHAAAEANPRKDIENPKEVVETIVEGTRHVVELARVCQARKFLFVSSGAVYGKRPQTPFSEDDEGTRDSPGSVSIYGEAKRKAESLSSAYSKRYGLESKIARCFTFVGPYMNLEGEFAISNFIRDRVHQNPIHIKGDGSAVRSYLYASDLMIWLWTILFRGQSRRPYNVGSDQAVTIAELAKIVAGDRVATAEPEGAKDSFSYYVPSIQRAKEELQLEVRVDLTEAIEKTIAWANRFVEYRR